MQRFDAFNKKSYFMSAILDFMPLKTGIRRIWTQHTLVDRKQQKNIIYVEKQGCVTSSPD